MDSLAVFSPSFFFFFFLSSLSFVPSVVRCFVTLWSASPVAGCTGIRGAPQGLVADDRMRDLGVGSCGRGAAISRRLRYNTINVKDYNLNQ